MISDVDFFTGNVHSRASRTDQAVVDDQIACSIVEIEPVAYCLDRPGIDQRHTEHAETEYPHISLEQAVLADPDLGKVAVNLDSIYDRVE